MAANESCLVLPVGTWYSCTGTVVVVRYSAEPPRLVPATFTKCGSTKEFSESRIYWKIEIHAISKLENASILAAYW